MCLIYNPLLLFLSDALDNQLGLIITRLREGFDYSEIIDLDMEESIQRLNRDDSMSKYLSFADYRFKFLELVR
jgi:hypothetical protein